MTESLREARQKHLQTLSNDPVSFHTITNSNCEHHTTFIFINIQVDDQGNYWEFWDCRTCGRIQ